MRKILILIISLTIIFSLIFFYFKDKFNINKIIEDIESNININIKLQDIKQWIYYPKISYQNNLSIYGNDGNLFIENSNIKISRDYGIISPILIKFHSPSILYKGINFRDSKIESKYRNQTINLKIISAKLLDGNINIHGQINLDNKKKFILKGSYNNISINRILKQLKIANWERVKIKLSSTNFSLNSVGSTLEKIRENLKGEMNINGSVFFVSREEERFGAAFLTLLADKFPNIKSLSQSLNYLLSKFADEPSDISGKINFNKGILTTEKLLIKNKKEKALLSASLDLKSNKIEGIVELYENNIIFLTIKIKGSLENPVILMGEELFIEGENTKHQNIKDIFEKGIQSLIDDILNLND